MFQLLYTSCAVRPMTGEDLSSLLDQARENNARVGITGILVYSNREFMQILEGEERVVHELYQIIALDDRHRSVRVFFESSVAERGFANWSMAFRNLDDSAPADITGWSPFLERGFTSEIVAEQPTAAQKLLLQLRDELK